MKSLIIGLALFAVAPAFAKGHKAAEDCAPIIKHTAGDEGTPYYVYPCGPGAAVTHRGCTEGEVAYDSQMDPSGNFWQQVKVVCHNGSFGNPGSNVHRGCIEGEIAYDSVPGYEGYEQVEIVCKNGKFVRAH